jgi:undecaprenyl-phosphate 4-deoxy-4-formamido-L-arabinose transferase
MTDTRPSISVVIPVYNGELTIRPLVERLAAVLPEISAQHEVLLVNDDSPDQSWRQITDLCAAYPWVRGIRLMRNYGQHNATLCGVRAARYPVVVTLDDDLQHPPEEIHRLISKLQEGYDVVYGYPNKMPHSLVRNFFSWFTKRVLSFVMGIKTVKEISAFRAFRTELRRAFDSYQNPGVILDALLSWGTTRFASVLVDEEPRQVGASNYNFTKLVREAFLVLTGYSTVPLKFASWLGFGFTIFGVVSFLYVIISYFIRGSIDGFTFLASTILIFSGVQLFTLGIFGEYLARIFDRSMDHPTYVIGEIVSGEEQE